jgi:hypothetical protein
MRTLTSVPKRPRAHSSLLADARGLAVGLLPRRGRGRCVVGGWGCDWRAVFVDCNAPAGGVWSVVRARSGSRVASVAGRAGDLSRRGVAATRRRHVSATVPNFNIAVTAAGFRSEIYPDIAFLAGLYTFGKIEVQRISLAKPRERFLQRRGVIDRHAVTTGVACDLRRAGRLSVELSARTLRRRRVPEPALRTARRGRTRSHHRSE